jgi:hypothetical protein
MIPETVSEYLNSLENQHAFKNYVKDVFKEISKDGKKVAYHYMCTDGVISASILKYMGWGDVFIPLDYDILKNEVLRPYLSSVDWSIIIDLEPFNEKTLDLYVDHHRSVIGAQINSQRIHFEVGEDGPSAAYVLFSLISSKTELPLYLKELAEVSKVTDTASFKIDPPHEKIDPSIDKSFLTDFDKLCWFVQDATNIEDEYSLQSNNELIELLTKNGVKALLTDHIIKRVNVHRKKRLVAEDYINSIAITDIVVIVNAPNQAFKQYAALRLGKKGAKIIVFLTEKGNLVTISLRQSKLNSKKEIESFRLDILAKKFNKSGGGHAEAAVSMSPSIESALKVLNQWKDEKGLSLSVNYYSSNQND